MRPTRQRWVNRGFVALVVFTGVLGFLLVLGLVYPLEVGGGRLAMRLSAGKLEVAWASDSVRCVGGRWLLTSPGTRVAFVLPASGWWPSSTSNTAMIMGSPGPVTITMWHACVPLLPSTLAMAALIGIAWRFVRRTARLGHCECGYPRAGLADDAACPECGHRAPSASAG